MQFDLRIDSGAHGATIGAARFLAFGCPHVIAISDWIAQRAVGMEPTATLPESVASLQQRFDVPAQKRGRLLVIEDAWIAAFSPS